MKSLVVVFVLLISNACWAGESEYAILFAQTHLIDLLSVCSLNRCSLTPAETSVFDQVQAAAANPPQAIFKANAEMEGSIYRVVGDQAWFNQDDLWLDPSDTIAYDVPHAAGLWLQVLGLNMDQQIVNSIRLKVQSALNMSVSTAATPYANVSLAVVFWSHSAFLRDGQANVVPVTPRLVSQVTNMDPDSLQFFSARWTSVNRATGAVRLDLNLMWTAQGNPMRGIGTVMMRVSSEGVIDANSIHAVVQQIADGSGANK